MSRSQVEFKVGNHIIRDTDEIANHFNDYFINIITANSTDSFL